MDIFYLGILIFLIVLAVFDLSVGVANDAVNFLSPAIGAKVAKFRTVLLVAAVGIFVGASTSSGMMDIARHGIMNPAYYTLDDVMCLFLAVAATDVILLDIFNTLGMRPLPRCRSYSGCWEVARPWPCRKCSAWGFPMSS